MPRADTFAPAAGTNRLFLSLSLDGQWRAATRWGEDYLEIRDVAQGRLATRLQHEAGFTASADSAFSPDGRRLLTVGLNGCVMWEVGAWKPRWTRLRAELCRRGLD